MKKHFCLILSIIASTHVYAMKMDVEINAMTINLSLYPAEILDLIASFLPFEDIESEQEFIERTKALKIKEIPQKYLSAIPFSKINCSAYCPSNKVIALLEKHHTNKEGRAFRISGPSPKLVIIDRKNNSQQIHSVGKFNTKYFEVAISRDGNLVVTVHSEIDIPASSHSEVLCYTNIVTIINFATNKTELCDIPHYFELRRSRECPSIAFNKQGTDIILYGYDQRQLNLETIYTDISENDIHPYMIKPLTVNTPDPNTNNKKTLEKYFKQQLICKELSKQITLIK